MKSTDSNIVEKPVKHLKNRNKKYNYIINKEIALSMAIQNKSDKDIAERFNVSIQAVNQMLKPYRDKINGYLAYKENKDNAFEFTQYLMHKSIDEKRIKKVGIPQSITGIAILEDKIRTIRGQATEIVDTRSMYIELKDKLDKIDSEEQQLMKQLESLDTIESDESMEVIESKEVIEGDE